VRSAFAAKGFDVFVEVLFAVIVGELFAGQDPSLGVDEDALGAFVYLDVAVWFAGVVKVAGSVAPTFAVDNSLLIYRE